MLTKNELRTAVITAQDELVIWKRIAAKCAYIATDPRQSRTKREAQAAELLAHAEASERRVAT